ncbi:MULTISPECIES: alpha/beta fold hydrolase [unclassified Polaromonas]|uniref:alpha/beta fold hydrolase n=1 Tax=unclassified Polaromonas TaxID=2638319 RepID=UPI0018CB8977|nr:MULTISPECIES: alpha/beta fold hydrolase [unclassified Polaromonas]MBG6070709.1 proline iminopeptidase [Polaromonas sp. CG_9.7]MBG6112983.1 proline iminopeptidase [Polaromonas sp. CG_9.2]MDH6186457.1 proline iminopeptidase [Polaromonas sp. CG_23.6]
MPNQTTPPTPPAVKAKPDTGWHSPHFVATGRGARMAYRDCGAPNGECWLVVHGGPGASCHPGLLAPFQLSRQRAVLPDQRGAGRSRPAARLAGNHTDQLVADLETLRRHLGIERWALLAGSWGTVVALRYAQAHPDRVTRLVLRGAFALTRREIFGLLRPDPRRDRAVLQSPYWPRAPYSGDARVLARLGQMLQSATPGVAARNVVRCWNLLELRSALSGLWRSVVHSASVENAPPGDPRQRANAHRRAWAQIKRQQRRSLANLQQARTSRTDQSGWKKFRIQGHYLRHKGFVRPGTLDSAVRRLALRAIPSDWVHGRFDAVCPPRNTRRWVAQQEALRNGLARAHWPLAGHLASEPGVRDTLAKAVRQPRTAP